MPGIDGLELARRLVGQPAPGAPPLMILSSVGRQLTSDQCNELRIATYLTKPVTASALFDAMLRTLRIPVRKQPQSATHASGAHSTLRILVAEDDPHSRTLVSNILAREGYSVTLAGDGREAVDLSAQGDFDLILMDLQMPNMSGFEAVGEIRKRERDTNTRVPIVALTAHAMAGDRERCLVAGMDDYMSKPIRPRDLLAKVTSVTSSGPVRGSVPQS